MVNRWLFAGVTGADILFSSMILFSVRRLRRCRGSWLRNTCTLLSAACLAGCSGSSAPRQSSPSQLSYAQGSIVATVGQAIAADTPTVTGTVTAYSVSPSLPAGLSLDSSSGAISGTPTAAAAQTPYTVTASNTSGSTTVTVAITVNPVAPSSLVYPQATIAGFVGKPIFEDAPTVLGGAATFSIAPALPPGLALNATTGLISGTPTTTAKPDTYTVTAANAGGSTTATLTVAVLGATSELLDLGHVQPVLEIRTSATRVLSADQGGHWVFRDYASGDILAEGDGSQPSLPDTVIHKPVDMAGQIFVVGIANGLQIHAATDGHLVATIDYAGLNVSNAASTTLPPWWQLASDGSYLCIGAKDGLHFYNAAGQSTVSHSGNYLQAVAFAAPNAVLAAMGPSGSSVIETISPSDGTSTVSSAFSGTFQSWFVDGSAFLTTQSTTVRVYSPAGQQKALMVLPDTENLAGNGNWIWTYAGGSSQPVFDLYSVGASSPAFSQNIGYLARLFPSGTTLGILPGGSAQITVIDLSGSTPVPATAALPIADLNAFAATSAGQWIAGNRNGVLIDGASVAGTPSASPRFFGYGAGWSIAGGAGRAAVATAIGKILIYDPSGPTLTQTIDFSSSQMALSSDGTVLAASAESLDSQYEPDRTLNIYSLPSGSVTNSFPYTLNTTTPFLVDFSLSASGSVVGQVTGVGNYTRTVTPVSGTPVLWSDSGANNSGPIRLSPDGTLVATWVGSITQATATNIYQNGTLVAAVAGAGAGWIDNSHLLANLFVGGLDPSTPAKYAGCVIYSSAGAKVASPALPQIDSFQPIDSGSIYDPSRNQIDSLTTGQPLWSGSLPAAGIGAVSGSEVVYESGTLVVVESQ